MFALFRRPRRRVGADIDNLEQQSQHVCEDESSTAQGPGRSCSQAGHQNTAGTAKYWCTLSFGSDVSHSTSWFQMGLFLELDPEQMTEDNLDDPDLEAELAALTGNAAGAGVRPRPKRKS